MKERVQRWWPVWARTFAVAAALAAAGCASLQPAGEAAARRDRAAVGAAYRPGDLKPVLPALTEQSPPEEYLRYALFNHPAVSEAYYDWFASVEKITGMRTPPDPKLTFQMDIQSIVTSVMPGLMFDFPAPGKLAAAAAGATAEAAARYAAFEQAVLQTAFGVKRAAFDLRLLDRKLELDRQSLALLTELEKLAEARNASGQGSLPDVLRTQIEQSRMQAEIENLADSRDLLLARFKAALGDSPDQPAPPVMKTPFPTVSLDVASSQLLAEALARNPVLRGLDAEIRQAEAGITLARKAGIPDFSAGAEADLKAIPVLWRPQATMTLPVWRDRIAADIAAARAGKNAAQAKLDAGRIALAVDFADKRFQVVESSRNLRLLRETLLPKTRQALDAARSAYLTGAVDFQTMLDYERMLLDFGMAEAEAQAQHDTALAELSLILLARPPPGAPLK